MKDTKIEWATHTFNPWIGCTKVGPGCDNCYAEADFDKRRHVVKWGAGQARHRTSADYWKQPFKWDRQYAALVEHEQEAGFPKPPRPRVFCASLADVFDNEVPIEWRVALFDLIRQTPHLDWLLLTKRIGNVKEMILDVARSLINNGGCGIAIGDAREIAAKHRDPLARWCGEWLLGKPPANVWLGSTLVNRPEMLRDAKKLKEIPAKITFWSVEPMLGDLGEIPPELLPDWVICGGESGPNARPMHPDWARSLRDQCAAAGVAFLFKQWGEWLPAAQAVDSQLEALGESKIAHKWPDGLHSWRVGKKAAGRLLDGVEHNGVPV